MIQNNLVIQSNCIEHGLLDNCYLNAGTIETNGSISLQIPRGFYFQANRDLQNLLILLIKIKETYGGDSIVYVFDFTKPSPFVFRIYAEALKMNVVFTISITTNGSLFRLAIQPSLEQTDGTTVGTISISDCCDTLFFLIRDY